MLAREKARCRWSSRNWNTCCRGWPGGARKCRSSAAASAPAAPVKPSWKPTAARSTGASGHVKQQLEDVRRIRGQQRRRRESAPIATVALVGYTNAGKSTLFNALTKAGVLESARMFATLDPTLRHVTLPSRRQVLLSDTVGFIRSLPHTLVSAFRATLEEVQKASFCCMYRM